MKKNSSTVFALLFAATLFAKKPTTVTKDRWVTLIQYAQLSSSLVKKTCPHFPAYTDLKTENALQQFQQLRSQWIISYPTEVAAFLKLPAIVKLNPSLVDLDLKKEGEEVSKFGHPVYNWVTKSTITNAELNLLAPHFPQPNAMLPLALQLPTYEAAINDWMLLFDAEYYALYNHPKLTVSNPYYKKTESFASPQKTFLRVKTTVIKPTPALFESGNKALDEARYQAYLRKWTLENDAESYYKIYEPENLAAYYNVEKKRREQAAENPTHLAH